MQWRIVSPYVAKADFQEKAIGFPGELVDNWEQKLRY